MTQPFTFLDYNKMSYNQQWMYVVGFNFCIFMVVYFTFCIAEEEFFSIAQRLKPFTKERMKIEPFPWSEGFHINMDELYTEQTLEKIERKLCGEETWTLQTYKDMFSCHKSV